MLKKTITAAICAVAFCLLISCWIVPSVRKTVLISRENPTPSSSDVSVPDISPLYMMMEYNGKVAVFRVGSLEPQEILNTPVAVLPEADQQMLREGIRIWTEDELQARLEDYS